MVERSARSGRPKCSNDSQGCGACTSLRSRLAAKKIPYQYVDVTSTPRDQVPAEASGSFPKTRVYKKSGGVEWITGRPNAAKRAFATFFQRGCIEFHTKGIAKCGGAFGRGTIDRDPFVRTLIKPLERAGADAIARSIKSLGSVRI